jgi:AAA+ ATPase superfamily predicted ATPase
MKEFYYNILVSKEDLADRKEDIDNICKLLKAGKKLVLYAPRRYGKSSIAKNILPDEIKKKNFVALYFDFMGVQSIDDVCVRLSYGISQGLSHYLPSKNFLKV